jgi:ferredoxin
MSRPQTRLRLVVDPVACDGIGMCSHLAPDLVGVDSWGFPMTPPGALTDRELRAAQSAVSGCPRGALHLRPVRSAPAEAPRGG